MRARKPKSRSARDNIELPARLAVRLRRVPADLAGEAGQSAISSARSRIAISSPDAEIHRLGTVVLLGGEHDALDGVVDVEELARRRAVAPEHDLALAATSHRIFRISAGITCDGRGSKLSPGPYRLTGNR